VLIPSVGVNGAAAAFLVTDTVLLTAFYAALPKATVDPRPAMTPLPN
jgi:hypothetical protein